MVRHLQKPFETITANVTSVKATHIQVLRSAVNSIREFHCMNPIVWGEEIISRRTTVEKWPIHIVELRDAGEYMAKMRRLYYKLSFANSYYI